MAEKISDLKKLFDATFAVVWDMDGVLVDSEGYHFTAHKLALAEEGIELTEPVYIREGVGIDPQKFYETIFTANGKPFSDSIFLKTHYRKLALYQQMQRDYGIRLIEPAVEVVRKMYAKGVLMAISSQVHREEVIRNLRGTDLLNYFPIIVALGDFGLPKKPAPDMYLKAVELLNADPKTTVAIEDSTVGAQAAIAAGISCLVVPNHYTKHQVFPAEARHTTFEAILQAVA